MIPADDPSQDAERAKRLCVPRFVACSLRAGHTFAANETKKLIILVPQVVPGRIEVGPDVPYQIVGVVGNEKMQGLIDDGSEGFYASMDQHSFYNPNLTVRAAIDPQTLQGAIRNAIDTLNRDQVISDFKTMEQIKMESMFGSR